MPHPIDAVANSGLTAALKAEGFRKAGRTWRRSAEPDGAIQIVNLQGSMFGSASEARCALNVALYFPQLAELLGIGRVTDAPSEADAHLRRRAAMLAPAARDDWFAVSPTDPASVARAGHAVLQVYMEVGAPWFARLSTLREARDEFARTGAHWHAAAASLAIDDRSGAQDSAVEALRAASPTILPHLKRWATQHALL